MLWKYFERGREDLLIQVADSIRLMSRRISDKSNPNTKYAIFVAKTQAPYEQLNFEHKKLIEVCN